MSQRAEVGSYAAAEIEDAGPRCRTEGREYVLILRVVDEVEP